MAVSAGSRPPSDPGDRPPRTGGDGDRPIDWEAAERSPEFRELIAARRRFVLPATVFFLTWYLGFILLCGYAQDFMGEEVVNGLTVGYLLALTQFLMVLVLGIMYLRRAEHTYDPLAQRAADRALEETR
jgi:uncharacterized membrane protein (DUF485 family)